MRGTFAAVFGPGMALLAVLALAGAAAAEPSIVLPRPGQIGIGVQGQYGTLLQSGTLGQDYGAGPGMAVRARYRMRYERAIGASFESQSFDTRNAPLASDSPFDVANGIRQKSLILTFSGVDIYQMFGTQTRTTKMINAGIGLVQVREKLSDGEYAFPGDAMYLSAGAGLERFFWRSWAYDLSGRYLAVLHSAKANHDLQISLGLIFYASY